MKYNEPATFNELVSYVASTYGEHYVGKNSVQVMDLLIANDLAREFCQGNIVKYVARYGRKGGANRKDLLKAMHYLVLLLGIEQKQ
jgi:hypothetical protein